MWLELKTEPNWFLRLLGFRKREYNIDTSELSEVLSRKFAPEPEPEELTGNEKALSEYLIKEALKKDIVSKIHAKKANSARLLRARIKARLKEMVA